MCQSKGKYEFVKAVKQVVVNEQVHVKDYKTQIKLIFIGNEINQCVEKYKQDYTDAISSWLLSKIHELNTEEHYFTISKTIAQSLIEYLQQLLKKLTQKRNVESKRSAQIN